MDERGDNIGLEDKEVQIVGYEISYTGRPYNTGNIANILYSIEYDL